MHSLRDGKKTGQHIVQPFGTEIAVCQVMQVNVCRNMCKNCILQSERAYMCIADSAGFFSLTGALANKF